MPMTISRNSTSANVLKELFKVQLIPQDFHVPASRGYGKRKSSFFIKCFFQNHGGLIARLKSQKTIPDYYFSIIIVIIEHLFM